MSVTWTNWGFGLRSNPYPDPYESIVTIGGGPLGSPYFSEVPVGDQFAAGGYPLNYKTSVTQFPILHQDPITLNDPESLASHQYTVFHGSDQSSTGTPDANTSFFVIALQGTTNASASPLLIDHTQGLASPGDHLLITISNITPSSGSSLSLMYDVVNDSYLQTFGANGSTTIYNSAVDGTGNANSVTIHFQIPTTDIYGNSPGDLDLSFEVVNYNTVDTTYTIKITDLDQQAPVPPSSTVSPSTIQNDYQGIERVALPSAQAATIAFSINSGTETETQYVSGLLAQAVDTTIPAVAVEASMYGVTGTSAEITSLVVNFLPAQVANATANGLNPQVYACEAIGLVFAFADENGGHGFANNFGPSNSAMPDTVAGDAAFAAAACNTIFGAASTTNLVSVEVTFVSNWEAFYTAHGLPGVANASTAQIDLAARGAAWGDMVGVALVTNLGPLTGQVINFLEDAAQGTAIYSASLNGQPNSTFAPLGFSGFSSLGTLNKAYNPAFNQAHNLPATHNDSAIPTISSDGNTLTLTTQLGNSDGGASSWFNNTKYSIDIFHASFDYQASQLQPGPADGFAFILQNDPRGPSAFGGSGGGLGFSTNGSEAGYTAISPSAVVEFNIYNGRTLGTNFVTDANSGSYNSTGAVAFWNGDKMHVDLYYNGSVLTETLTDLTNPATYTQTYAANLAQILGSHTAYIGFSGADGGFESTQQVSNFHFTSY
jgi:hypothetical protein